MRLKTRLLSGATLALLSAAAVAEDSAADWLLRMSDSARSLNYQGVVVYRDAQMFETLHLLHRNRDGQERERLVSLTGEPREIQREDDKLTCLLPKERKLTAERTGFRGLLPRLTREMVQQFSEYYVLQLVGSARVAGRVCRGIQIVPRDSFRYGYEFWADEGTGIPLKVRLLSGQGRLLEELVFTQIEFPKSIADTEFEPDRAQSKVLPAPLPVPEGPGSAAAAATEPELTASRWTLGQLPPGFRIALRDQRVLPDQRGMLEHTLLSDGLSTVSIFSTRRPATGRSFRGLSHMGAMSAYGRTIGDFHIAVVGEVPLETVRLIGDGIKADTSGSSPPMPPAQQSLGNAPGSP
jgi:sigma-E factor negative regulatory protein RseB